MSSARRGGAVLVDALERYGVTRVFGNPGTNELPVLAAIGASSLSYELAPHEDVAVGMAAGYAEVLRDRVLSQRGSGEAATPAELAGLADPSTPLPLGVVNLHLVAGVAHGLGNLYDAWMAGTPLLVTAGTHSQSFRHEEPILSGDLRRHVEPYAKLAAEVTDADALPSVLRRAVRTALTPPTGPVFLALPTDVAEAETSADPEPLGTIPSAGRGDPAALDDAAERIAAANEVVLLAGDGVARAGPDAVDAAVEFAEAAGARVHGEALSAAISFPRSHEQWASVLPPDQSAMRRRLDADALVLAGCSTNTTLARHDAPLVPGDPELVHLGADPARLGKRLPADVTVTGDPGAVLADLAERVARRVPGAERRERTSAAAERAAAVRSEVRARGTLGDGDAPEAGDANDRPTPAQLVEAMERVAPGALVIDEGIGAKYALLARWDLGHGDFHSNKGGCLGFGLSASVGAALAETERRASDRNQPAPGPRPVFGLVGDGSYGYYPQAVRAGVRAGVDLTVVVASNGGYGSVAAQAEELLEGGAEDVPGLAFESPTDVAANAESHGANGYRVADVATLEETLDRAVAEDGVSVVDVSVADRVG